MHDTEAESDNLLVSIDFVLQAEPEEESFERQKERNDSNEKVDKLMRDPSWPKIDSFPTQPSAKE